MSYPHNAASCEPYVCQRDSHHFLARQRVKSINRRLRLWLCLCLRLACDWTTCPCTCPCPCPYQTTQHSQRRWIAAWSSNAKKPYTWVGIRFVFIFMCSVVSLAADAGLHTELTRCRGRINHEQRSSLCSKK